MWQCDIESFVTKAKTRKDRHKLFVMPYHIKETGEPIKAWSEVTHRTQIIFDMREEANKHNIALNRNIHTFKATDCDVFQDRP